MRRGLPVRFATLYLNGQAMAVILWWAGLYAVPAFRSHFVGGSLTWEALQAFLIPDLVFLVVLGFVSAHQLRQDHRQFSWALAGHVAAGAYSALVVIGLAAFSGAPTLNAMLMSTYLVIGPFLLGRKRR